MKEIRQMRYKTRRGAINRAPTVIYFFEFLKLKRFHELRSEVPFVELRVFH